MKVFFFVVDLALLILVVWHLNRVKITREHFRKRDFDTLLEGVGFWFIGMGAAVEFTVIVTDGKFLSPWAFDVDQGLVMVGALILSSLKAKRHWKPMPGLGRRREDKEAFCKLTASNLRVD